MSKPSVDGYCGEFDARVARSGTAAIFVRTIEGAWRLEPDLSRHAWEQVGSEALADNGRMVHALLRDKATGYVSWWLLSHPGLLAEHPRLDARLFECEDEAQAELEALGTPPMAGEAWLAE
jgi:hypothetical protein